MNNFRKIWRQKSELSILICAVLILVLTSCLMQYPFQSAAINQLNDAESYKIACDWLYSTKHFASFTRPFLFPLLIGLPRLLGFEYNENFVIALNLVFWFWSILLLFRVVRDISGEKMAFRTTIILASCFSFHCFIFSVHTEISYIFILLSHVFCLYQYLKTEKNSWLYGGIWLLGASVVIRPTLAYIVFVLYFALTVRAILKKIRLKKFAIISLLLFSTIGLQMLNMYRCSNRLKISYIGDVTWYLYMGSYAINIKMYPNQTIDFYAQQWQREVDIRLKTYFSIGRSRSPSDVDKLPSIENLIKTDMVNQLKENKWGLTFTFFRSLFVNSRSGTQYAFDTKNDFNLPYFGAIQQLFFKISQVQNLINSSFVLLILPIIILKRYKKQRKHLDKSFLLAVYSWFLAFSILLFSTISFTQGDRFHIITVPLTLFSLVLLFVNKNTSLSPILMDKI